MSKTTSTFSAFTSSKKVSPPPIGSDVEHTRHGGGGLGGGGGQGSGRGHGHREDHFLHKSNKNQARSQLFLVSGPDGGFRLTTGAPDSKCWPRKNDKKKKDKENR